MLYNSDGKVVGVATGDMGINKEGAPKATFARGIELRAKQTLFGEGCRGSLSEVTPPAPPQHPRCPYSHPVHIPQ